MKYIVPDRSTTENKQQNRRISIYMQKTPSQSHSRTRIKHLLLYGCKLHLKRRTIIQNLKIKTKPHTTGGEKHGASLLLYNQNFPFHSSFTNNPYRAFFVPSCFRLLITHIDHLQRDQRHKYLTVNTSLDDEKN
jgi:hypothetical protein